MVIMKLYIINTPKTYIQLLIYSSKPVILIGNELIIHFSKEIIFLTWLHVQK